MAPAVGKLTKSNLIDLTLSEDDDSISIPTFAARRPGIALPPTTTIKIDEDTRRHRIAATAPNSTNFPVQQARQQKQRGSVMEPSKKHVLSPIASSLPREKRRKIEDNTPPQLDRIPRSSTQRQQLSSSTKATIITGSLSAEASNATSSRISPEGRIQKPRAPLNKARFSEQISNAIRNTVIPIVKLALRKHREIFSKEERNTLGASITNELVLSTDFRQSLHDNEGAVPERLRTQLTRQAQNIADAKAIKFHADKVRAEGQAKLLAARSLQKRESGGIQEPIKSSSSTPRSLSEEASFERPGKARSQSVSPPTSYSNGPEDVERGSSPARREARSTRAAVSSYDLVRRRKSRKSDGSSIHNNSQDVSDNEFSRGRLIQKTGSNSLPIKITLKPSPAPKSTPALKSTSALKPASKTPQLVVEKKKESFKNMDQRASSFSIQIPIPPISAHPSPEKIKPRFPVTTLLRQRDIHGLTCRGSFKSVVTNYLEDSLVQLSEWTDCSGDVSSISWTSDNSFMCGALAHYDPHNQQYNKPGNLLLGSVSKDSIRAFPDHKIIRPRIYAKENAENASEAMRRSQAPWLYTSVVSIAHSEVVGYNDVRGHLEPIGYRQTGGYNFTASFDATVKVWSTSVDGSTMDLRGTWSHESKVNFVVASPHHNLVATASESNRDAVRVYTFDEDNIQSSPYASFGGNKASQQAVSQSRAGSQPQAGPQPEAESQTQAGVEETEASPKRDIWAYHPATIQWGQAIQVRNLLLVGYSPRSNTGFDQDIPDDKKNTGELCVWNAESGERVAISGAHTQNVFEVLWHPTLPIFVAATSPAGSFDSEKTKTQVRLFCLSEMGVFMVIKSLDCPAMDVNELTIRPNSDLKSFVTASCTDGNTYVWDTAQGDDATHILEHGESLDNPLHDLPLELGDSGVKFAAWGQSTERFYTGGSDGKVKCWNIKAPPAKAFVRTVLTISGGIQSGAFSKDFSKLLIGDATGKVHLLGIDDSDIEDEKEPEKPTAIASRRLLQRGGILTSSIRRPKVIIHHSEPPPPAGYDIAQEVEEGIEEITRQFFEKGQIAYHSGSGLAGVYQGPNYADTGFFRADAHVDNDPSQPLLPEFLLKQQFQKPQEKEQFRVSRLPSLRTSLEDVKSHLRNIEIGLGELDLSSLSLETKAAFSKDRVELNWDRNEFDYEPRAIHPSNVVFKTGEESSGDDDCSDDSMDEEEFFDAEEGETTADVRKPTIIRHRYLELGNNEDDDEMLLS